MMRRFRLFATASVAAILLATSGPGAARGEDVTGRVKSVDATTKTIVVHDRKSDRDISVVVGEATLIETKETDPKKAKKMTFARIVPGAMVTVRDAVVASLVDIEGEYVGTVLSVDEGRRLVLSEEKTEKKVELALGSDPEIISKVEGGPKTVGELKRGSRIIAVTEGASVREIVVEFVPESIVSEFLHNFKKNLFKPLLLFFYAGFLVPILRVKFEFPYVIYQALTIYLLISIGWHGGEELAGLSSGEVGNAAGFMVVGFLTNFVIGIVAYIALSLMTTMRRIDKATVAGYYGSDSAGTFVTCLGVLATAGIAYRPYMPVMLAVMEIPGCLVALYLVSRLRATGMDPVGNMPDEKGYNPSARPTLPVAETHGEGHGEGHTEAEIALHHGGDEPIPRKKGGFSPEMLHEVFLNPGLYLLFGGIAIGLISGLQGPAITKSVKPVFDDLFQGMLCLFLLEMGMTASRKLKDLTTAGPGFIAFALIFPNVFATAGIFVAHAYSLMTGTQFELGTYVLFAVLCGAASYIAVPAVQRLAIPEASPTLPLAASLGLTFSYNVTIGIPIYIEVAKAVMRNI